jgi:hypothetical protein
MRKILLYLLDSVLSNVRSRAALQLEVIALRHQLEGFFLDAGRARQRSFGKLSTVIAQGLFGRSKPCFSGRLPDHGGAIVRTPPRNP